MGSPEASGPRLLGLSRCHRVSRSRWVGPAAEASHPSGLGVLVSLTTRLVFSPVDDSFLEILSCIAFPGILFLNWFLTSLENIWAPLPIQMLPQSPLSGYQLCAGLVPARRPRFAGCRQNLSTFKRHRQHLSSCHLPTGPLHSLHQAICILWRVPAFFMLWCLCLGLERLPGPSFPPPSRNPSHCSWDGECLQTQVRPLLASLPLWRSLGRLLTHQRAPGG